ncbi:vitellogenin-1-like [Eurosta solidaginis]|uniref:vitellogenin-1-like n=1 Tax=Eurosta solidaginis TaxID=178769 RepID=UPI00353153EA
MNLFKIFGLISLIVASASAAPNHHGKSELKVSMNSMKPRDWISIAELQSLPSNAEDITLQQLENMSVEEGESLINKIYHLSKMNHALRPSYVPSPSNVPVIFMKSNGQHEETNLSEMASTAKNQAKLSAEEVTIFITGLPETSPAVAKANKKLVEAYMERYMRQQRSMGGDYETDYKQAKTSSEEGSESWREGREISGDLVIIKLGNTLTNMKRYAQLDIEKTGEMLAKVLIDMHSEMDFPENLHLIGQGMGAHVAGVAARKFKRWVGHSLRRITALDPAKWFANDKYYLNGLARGDADFVDVIHTNTHGLGIRERMGDADFYVMGPDAIAPGANNVVEASMRATRYFAESVRPGMEHNFPAVPAKSMRQYERKEGSGKRAFMGIDADYDLKGDFMLEVNAKSPFGKRSPAKKQSTYHSLHQSWQSSGKEGLQY